MAKKFQQVFHQKRYENGKQAHKKMLNIISHREMLIKTTMMYYNTYTRMAKIKKTDNTNSW